MQVDKQNFNGFNINDEFYAVNFNLMCGLRINDRSFLGIGIGYLNFDLNYSGVQGLSAFSTFEFTPPSYKIINFYFRSNLGYSQLFKQSGSGIRNETGTSLAEFNIGLKYHLNHKIEIYLQSGILYTQQSAFLPIRLGMGF